MNEYSNLRFIFHTLQASIQNIFPLHLRLMEHGQIKSAEDSVSVFLKILLDGVARVE
jgi:hypothetical protein